MNNITVLKQHPAFDSIKTPFNRIDISPQLAVYLPCRHYVIKDGYQNAHLRFTIGDKEYIVAVTVICSLPDELRYCLNEVRLETLMVRRITQRLKSLSILITDLSIENLLFLK